MAKIQQLQDYPLSTDLATQEELEQLSNELSNDFIAAKLSDNATYKLDKNLEVNSISNSVKIEPNRILFDGFGQLSWNGDEIVVSNNNFSINQRELNILSGNFKQSNSKNVLNYSSRNAFLQAEEAGSDGNSYGPAYTGTKGFCILSVIRSDKAILLSGNVSSLSSLYDASKTSLSDRYVGTFPTNSRALRIYEGKSASSPITINDLSNLYYSFALSSGSGTRFRISSITSFPPPDENDPNYQFLSNGYGIAYLATFPSGLTSSIPENISMDAYVDLWNNDDNAIYCPGFPEVGNAVIENFYAQHAEGGSVRAIGKYSHAEGRDTLTDVRYTHAEGSHNVAGEMAAHAEGFYTLALERYTHSENYATSAIGRNSHAEGNASLASGENSHVEGLSSIASGKNSHAEGLNSVVNGENSHVEGVNTKADGTASHAEGRDTVASGNRSHAEGSGTEASGWSSHAEGGETNAQGRFSHAEGWGTTALSVDSDNVAHGTHAEGIQTQAGNGAVITNFSSGLNGIAAHAEGGGSAASGRVSHAEGLRTLASGIASHSEGVNTEAKNQAEHAQGQYNKSNRITTSFGNGGNTIHSIGIGTSDSNKKNAVEVMQDGKVFVTGVGGYNGTNPTASGIKDVATVVNEKIYALSGMIYDCSISSEYYRAIEDIVKLFGGKIINSEVYRNTILWFTNGTVSSYDLTGEIDRQNTMVSDGIYLSTLKPSKVEIGTGVTGLGDHAFSLNDNLTSVTIGNSVSSIGSAAFTLCQRLKYVTIPDSVLSIGNAAFNHCNIDSLIIPSSVLSIHRMAFHNSGVKSLTFEGRTAAEVSAIENYPWELDPADIYNII